MSDIHIHRAHTLGLPRARELAWQWAEEAESRLALECTVIEGDDSDTVEFTRSGVKGRLLVAADRFDLHAKLGLLLGAFTKTIEAEIEKNLDALLAGAKPAALAKAAGSKSAPGRKKAAASKKK